MTTHINVAGVWKAPTPSINVAGVWKNPSVHINVAGVWKTAHSPLNATVRADGRYNSYIGTSGACYCGLAFYTSGYEYEYGNTGSLTNSTVWTTDGSSNFWIEWNRTGGTLSDWNNVGSGYNGVRRQVSATVAYRISRTTTGTNTIQGYIQCWDAASGGTLIDQGPTATWSAYYEYNSCPLCCFTPDTMVTMASGLEMPLGKIKAGDEILIKRPEDGEYVAQKVGEVIGRTERAMYKVYFDDGTILEASDDHPMAVEGKGYAAINPTYEYKNLLNEVEQLNVGDQVSKLGGGFSKIVRIEAMHYPGLVLTLSNSFWFANGKLVY